MFTNMWNSLHELQGNILHRKCRASGSGRWGGWPPTRDASQEEGHSQQAERAPPGEDPTRV